MKIISRKRIFDKFFGVEEVFLQYPESEQPVTRFYVDKVKAAAILLYNTEANSVVMIKQHRVPLMDEVDAYLWEIPAGVIDGDEKPVDCAIREAMEETGYVVRDCKEIYSIFTSPGYTNERLHIFYAEVSGSDRTNKGGGKADEHEFLNVKEFTADEAFAMLDSGVLPDAKTIIALQWLRNKLSDGVRK